VAVETHIPNKPSSIKIDLSNSDGHNSSIDAKYLEGEPRSTFVIQTDIDDLTAGDIEETNYLISSPNLTYREEGNEGYFLLNDIKTNNGFEDLVITHHRLRIYDDVGLNNLVQV